MESSFTMVSSRLYSHAQEPIVPASPQLPGICHALGPVLDKYGYLGVGGVVMLEDFGIPVPGETILIAAAIYAGRDDSTSSL